MSSLATTGTMDKKGVIVKEITAIKKKLGARCGDACL
jgi:hypothetical protein